MRNKFTQSLFCATAMALVASPAVAQEQAGQDPDQGQDNTSTAADEAEGSAAFGDIVVTAQRRSENLQRAALAISAVGGDELRSAGVSDPRALTRLVPSLQVTGASGPYSNFFIRGVGNFNANPLSESAVAFNYDGVFVGRPSSTTGFFYDLERIEVLKGPQGTLYGRNATGGAINVIPRRPGSDFEASVGAEYGNYDALRLDAMVNVPVGDRVAIRAAGLVVQHDGYMDDGHDDQDEYGGRLQVRLDVTDNLEINLGFDYFSQQGAGTGGTPIGLGVDTRAGVNSLAGQALYQTIPHALGGRNYDPVPNLQYQNHEFWGVSATATWQSDIGTVTFIPAHRQSNLDSINTSAVGFYVFHEENIEQTSLELRYASPDINPLRLLLGGFYYNETTDTPRFLVNHQYDHFDQTIQTDTESAAVFGRLTYDVTDTIRINGGLRYTHEQKGFDGTLQDLQRACLAGPFGCPGAIPFPYVEDRITVAFAPDGSVIPQFGADGTIQVGNYIVSHERESFDSVTWRAGAEWDVGPSSLLYASYETGFKSGGFYATNDRGVFEPETIRALTLGSKNRFFDNRLQLNAEAFVWRYRDQQVSHLTLDSRGAAVFITENVGRATFKGFELEGRVLVSENTVLRADVQYLDAVYNDFNYNVPNLGAPPLTGCVVGAPNTVTNSYAVNCSGLRPPQAPEWTINLGVSQTIPLSSGAEIVLEAKTHFQTETLTSLDFIPQQYQDSYWMSDAQLTYREPDGRWFVAAFVNNIEDTTVMGSTFQLPFAITGDITATLRPPRTYGVRAGFNF